MLKLINSILNLFQFFLIARDLVIKIFSFIYNFFFIL